MQLYGLIHARYIVTTHGLTAMHSKFEHGAFGKCPRSLCFNQSVVPVSPSPAPAPANVRFNRTKRTSTGVTVVYLLRRSSGST